MFILEAIVVVLVVDFVSGFVHWTEDTFWTESTPVLGKWIVAPNVAHHRKGSEFVTKTWMQSSWDLLVAGGIILVTAWSAGLLSWHIGLFVIVGVNANQIHKWNHMKESDVPYPVRFLQRLRLIQSIEDHRQHHRGQKNKAYCVITPFTNRVLDRIHFWRLLEKMLVPVFAAPRRKDLLMP